MNAQQRQQPLTHANTLYVEVMYGGLTPTDTMPIRLYSNGETKQDVKIDLDNELRMLGAHKTRGIVLGTGSTQYNAPKGYALIAREGLFERLNEKGNVVSWTQSIMAAYKA